MTCFLNSKAEASPGNPHGVSAWVIYEVYDLNVAETGKTASFRCMYSVTPNSPMMWYGYTEEEIPDTFTYTRTFIIELTEDGYAAGVS